MLTNPHGNETARSHGPPVSIPLLVNTPQTVKKHVLQSFIAVPVINFLIRMTECDPDLIEQLAEEPERPVYDGPPPPLHIRFWLSLKMGVVGKLLPIWIISLVLSFVAIWTIEWLLPPPATTPCGWGPWRFLIIAVISFVSMYLNTALGMGYGVTIIPVLLLLGIRSVKIIPAVLAVQFLAEIAAGISHQSAGNINLSQQSPHMKVAMVLAGTGIIGGLIAVKAFVSVNSYSETWGILAIGMLVLMVGIVILTTMGRRFRFSWRKIIVLGLIASFIKGFSGGGYGPIVTGGQVLCGVGGKAAIGVKSIAEGLVCLVVVMGFLIGGQVHDLKIAYPLALGAVCSTPFSAYTVRQLGTKKVTILIAIVTIILGAILIVKQMRGLGYF